MWTRTQTGMLWLKQGLANCDLIELDSSALITRPLKWRRRYPCADHLLEFALRLHLQQICPVSFLGAQALVGESAP